MRRRTRVKPNLTENRAAFMRVTSTCRTSSLQTIAHLLRNLTKIPHKRKSPPEITHQSFRSIDVTLSRRRTFLPPPLLVDSIFFLWFISIVFFVWSVLKFFGRDFYFFSLIWRERRKLCSFYEEEGMRGNERGVFFF